MTKKKEETIYRVGVYHFDEKNVILQPQYDFSTWFKQMTNILQNNKYSPFVRESTIEQMKKAFFAISKDIIKCPKTEKDICKSKFPQDDFLYITCINKKRLFPFYFVEIIFIILLFLLLIKVIYNVYTKQ